MRRIAALAAAFSMVLLSAPLYAAPIGGTRAALRAQTQTGGINGTATGSQGQTLASYTIRVRNADTGQLAGSTTTGATGQFTFTGLDPANYVVEIVDQAGHIIGTSSMLSVAAGQTVSMTVGASMTAGAAAIAGGATGFWTSTAGILTIAAVGAGVTGIVVAVNKSNASPSR